MYDRIRRRLERIQIDAMKMEVEQIGESGGHCDCCGNTSRTIWGNVYQDKIEMIACYYVQWTINQPFSVHPANVDLIIGRWGDDSTAEERCAVSLVYFEEDERPGVMVIDAAQRPVSASTLVGAAMTREDVVGTPFASVAFAIFDAVIAQDKRLG